jgi:hypothetical protein
MIGSFTFKEHTDGDDFLYYDISYKDISIPFHIIVIDATKKCYPECNLNFVEFIWKYLAAVKFKMYIIICTILYSITIYLLHYYPRHVSSINMSIFRRKDCIHTASGIFVLCKRLHSTESENTRCCVDTIFPPEDGHVNARNMYRIIM